VLQDLWHNKQLQQHAIAAQPCDSLGTEETSFLGISKSARWTLKAENHDKWLQEACDVNKPQVVHADEFWLMHDLPRCEVQSRHRLP
jgi:hypothetical protein